MNDSMMTSRAGRSDSADAKLNLMALVGSGDKIGLAMLPLIIAGVAVAILRPEWLAVGELAKVERPIVWALLVVGIVGWLWSVALILTKVPRHELITSGPFAIVKHPLYTAVSLLVLPAASLLLGSWLGVALGAALYAIARHYAPAEEAALADEFGDAWRAYHDAVAIPWL